VNESGTRSNDWKIIIGGIALIAVLFAGIKFTFWGLGKMVGQDNPDVSQSQPPGASQSRVGEPSGPAYCVHCGEQLPEGFQWGQYCPFCGEKNPNW